MVGPREPGRMTDETVTTPSEAFSLLANDQRMAILEALWEEPDPLPFSALREAVGVRDSGQFNYHLGKLSGLYVRETDDGYGLTRPGRRVLTAVLAGDLLDRPEVEPTRVDRPCPRCGADVLLRYDDEVLRVLCTECPGLFEGEVETPRERRENPPGTLSVLPLPPAGVKNRTPEEILEVALQWLVGRTGTRVRGLCPDCSGSVVTEIRTCPDHRADEGLCPTCGSRYAAIVIATCEVCGEGSSSVLSTATWGHPDVNAFFRDHGHDSLWPDFETLSVVGLFDETVRSREPLDYEMRWTLDGESMRVRVNGDLEVLEVERTGG